MRKELRDGLGVATTLGYAPGFLHSTGQLHKGGANNGLFIQITADSTEDMIARGEGYTFGELTRAQALGDWQSLISHNRRVVHIHLGPSVQEELLALQQVMCEILDE